MEQSYLYNVLLKDLFGVVWNLFFLRHCLFFMSCYRNWNEPKINTCPQSEILSQVLKIHVDFKFIAWKWWGGKSHNRACISCFKWLWAHWACYFVFKTETTMLIKLEFKSVIGKRCFGLWFVLSSQWLGQWGNAFTNVAFGVQRTILTHLCSLRMASAFKGTIVRGVKSRNDNRWKFVLYNVICRRRK